ncbi:MAG: hypothetical protein ACR2MK_09895 [Solirubrobacteraceae bacterium]
MRRLYVVSLIALGLVVFLLASALLARALSVGGAEDAAITALVRAEARGNRRAVVSDISGCVGKAACQARATAVTAALKRAGNVSIIQIQESAGFSLGATLGTARVAWLVGGSLPRVQCVRVRRSGNVLQGFRIELLAVSVRIRSDAGCPSRF